MSIGRWKRSLAESIICTTSSGLKTSGSLRYRCLRAEISLGHKEASP